MHPEDERKSHSFSTELQSPSAHRHCCRHGTRAPPPSIQCPLLLLPDSLLTALIITVVATIQPPFTLLKIDQAGDVLLRQWQSYGLPTHGIHRIAGASTPCVSIVFDKGVCWQFPNKICAAVLSIVACRVRNRQQSSVIILPLLHIIIIKIIAKRTAFELKQYVNNSIVFL